MGPHKITTDDQCAEIVRELIEHHIANPDRTVILDWLEKLIVAHQALTGLGLYKEDV